MEDAGMDDVSSDAIADARVDTADARMDASRDSGPDTDDTGADDSGADDTGADDSGHDATTDPADTEPPPRLGPPYPIVLAHGFFGFEDFAGLAFETYFFQVKADLMERGEQVFTPEVDPFNNSEVRGEQLADRIEDILAMTGHEKVLIIGHSQGGLDARYVASTRPDLVAAVVSYATPHRGSPIADIALGLIRDDRSRALIDQLVRIIGAPIYDEVGEETSVVAAVQQLSAEGTLRFNETYEDAPTVGYFSIAGRTDLVLARDVCRSDDAPSFIRDFDGTRDLVDPLFDIPESILDGDNPFNPIANDGLVRVEDAQHGVFLGCVPADHMDEVGQILGDRPGLGNGWRHKPFFRDLVSFLRSEGY